MASASDLSSLFASLGGDGDEVQGEEVRGDGAQGDAGPGRAATFTCPTCGTTGFATLQEAAGHCDSPTMVAEEEISIERQR